MLFSSYDNEDFQNLKTLIVVVFALIVVPKYTASSYSPPPPPLSQGDHLIKCTNQDNCHFTAALVEKLHSAIVL